MYSHMPSHFRIVLFLLLIAKGMSTGLQFISLPTSAFDLIYIQTPWRNPSLLNSVGKSPELSFAYGKWFGDTENLSLSWQGQIRSISSGLKFRYVGINDIELRSNTPSSKPIGYYGAYGMSTKASTSFGRGNFRYGLALQMISMQIYQDNSSGYAADLGISWQMNKAITFSGSALNLGKMNNFRNQRPRLPTRYIGHASYHKDNSQIILSIEKNELIEKPLFYLGSTFKKDKIFFGATGMVNDKTKSLLAGVGMSFGIYTFSYGFQYGNQDIGFPQIIDISFRLP